MAEYISYKEQDDRVPDILPYYVYPLHTNVPFHWHNDIEIIYPQTDGVLILDEKQIPFNKNDILFCNKRQLHGTILHSAGLIFYIVVSSELFKYGYNGLVKNETVHFPEKLSSPDEKYITLMSELTAIKTPADSASEFIVISLLFKLLSYLLDDGLLTFNNEKRSTQISYIKSGIAYINDNLTSKITLDDIADTTGVSKAYFMRLFKKTTGTTVNSYIHNRRIEAAKKDILSGVSFAEVAYKYDYADVAHFNHTFKKHTGVTPKEYKSNNS